MAAGEWPHHTSFRPDFRECLRMKFSPYRSFRLFVEGDTPVYKNDWDNILRAVQLQREYSEEKP